MSSTIEKLREVTRRCKSGEALSDELMRWLGSSLEQFLDRHCRTIEDALGLRASRGGVPWWLEEAMRQRDAALRALAGHFFSALSLTARAKQIHALAVRYGASSWLRDHDCVSMPSVYRGKINEWLWRAFKSGAPMPICERQLRHILAD
jgi:hypothetical protein